MLDLFITNTQLFKPKILDDGLELCGSVDYCDVFISCLDSHSDGTHSLQRIHWWASNVMLNFSKSVLMKKQTGMAWGWTHFQWIFVFVWTIPLRLFYPFVLQEMPRKYKQCIKFLSFSTLSIILPHNCMLHHLIVSNYIWENDLRPLALLWRVSR